RRELSRLEELGLLRVRGCGKVIAVRPATSEQTGSATRSAAWRSLRVELWNIILIPVALVMIVPIFWMFDSSLKTTQQQFAFPPVLLPEPVFFQNYVDGTSALPFG